MISQAPLQAPRLAINAWQVFVGAEKATDRLHRPLLVVGVFRRCFGVQLVVRVRELLEVLANPGVRDGLGARGQLQALCNNTTQ